MKGRWRAERRGKCLRGHLVSQMEPIRKRQELRGSKSGHETKAIFIVSICKKAPPSPRTPTHPPTHTHCKLGAPRVRLQGSRLRGSPAGAGGAEPGPWRMVQAAAVAQPAEIPPPPSPWARPANVLPGFCWCLPHPRPQPIYSLSKTIKKRSTSLTSRSPFQ